MAKQIQPEYLYHKFLQGECDPEELEALFLYFGTADEQTLRELIQTEMSAGEEDPVTALEKQKLAELKKLVDARIREVPITRTLKIWPRIAAAASIILAISAGGYFLLHKPQPQQQIAQNQVHDIAPGGNKAIITLSSGKKINVTDAKVGIIAREKGLIVTKAKDGTISYEADKIRNTGNEVAYNIITTPRGGQSPVVLPDGTKVLLDAASSIRYPLVFNGKNRMVSITGQAYFEVVHNSKQPFRVAVKGQIIEDIGTQFNINAYDDEPVIKTTLLEGSIRLTKGTDKVFLKPGQQAVTRTNNNTIKVNTIDTEEAIAWKNGYFLFDHENVESVMRKVSRWYDVDIIYPPGQKMPDTYWGSINRYSNVSKVLKMLEVTGEVRFKVEGKKILVTRK